MYCDNCGGAILEEASFCDSCGAPTAPDPRDRSRYTPEAEPFVAAAVAGRLSSPRSAVHYAAASFAVLRRLRRNYGSTGIRLPTVRSARQFEWGKQEQDDRCASCLFPRSLDLALYVPAGFKEILDRAICAVGGVGTVHHCNRSLLLLGDQLSISLQWMFTTVDRNINQFRSCCDLPRTSLD